MSFATFMNIVEHSWAKKGNDKIWESNKVKLPNITIDNKLKFDSDIANICFKASQKLYYLDW